MCNSSKGFIINIKRRKIFYTPDLKQMQKLNFFVYLLCVSIIGVQGFLTIRDFKIDAVTRGTETTQKVSNVLTSYSQYLQGLN